MMAIRFSAALLAASLAVLLAACRDSDDGTGPLPPVADSCSWTGVTLWRCEDGCWVRAPGGVDECPPGCPRLSPPPELCRPGDPVTAYSKCTCDGWGCSTWPRE